MSAVKPLGALTSPYIEHHKVEHSEADVINALGKAAAEITAAIGGRAPVLPK